MFRDEGLGSSMGLGVDQHSEKLATERVGFRV